MEHFYLNETNRNENLGNDIASFIREMAEAELVEIKRENDISMTARAVNRVAFNVWIGPMILRIKEITLVANRTTEDGERKYNYMFLDKHSVDLPRVTGDCISMEMGGI